MSHLITKCYRQVGKRDRCLLRANYHHVCRLADALKFSGPRNVELYLVDGSAYGNRLDWLLYARGKKRDTLAAYHFAAGWWRARNGTSLSERFPFPKHHR